MYCLQFCASCIQRLWAEWVGMSCIKVQPLQSGRPGSGYGFTRLDAHGRLRLLYVLSLSLIHDGDGTEGFLYARQVPQSPQRVIGSGDHRERVWW